MNRGTDIGPPCWRCEGTIWQYNRILQSPYWGPRCVSCFASDGPICLPDSADPTAAELRAEHVAYDANLRAQR